MNRLVLILLLLTGSPALSAVDTLRGLTAVEDATLYNFLACDPEIEGEDCRRYNTGGLSTIMVGKNELDDHRAVMRFPGWDRALPDSSVLELTCTAGDDTDNRRVFVYPLTRRFFEGDENVAYPEPDSGVTWYHAWLDIGDSDSLSWTTPGGDYTAAVACTVLVSRPGVCRVRPFNRILNWWRTNSADPGIVLINQNSFPANSARRSFGASEGTAELAPRLLLYYGDEPVEWNGRRLKILTGARE